MKEQQSAGESDQQVNGEYVVILNIDESVGESKNVPDYMRLLRERVEVARQTFVDWLEQNNLKADLTQYPGGITPLFKVRGSEQLFQILQNETTRPEMITSAGRIDHSKSQHEIVPT